VKCLFIWYIILIFVRPIQKFKIAVSFFTKAILNSITNDWLDVMIQNVYINGIFYLCVPQQKQFYCTTYIFH